MTTVDRREPLRRAPTESGLVLVNRDSGPKDSDLDSLRARFAGHDVEQCDPRALAERVRDARKDGRPFVAIAGGDGSIRTAAAELAHGETALVAVPEGTRNHFAKAVGTPTIDDAAAASDPQTNAARVVDLGRVNDHCFVNNASLGTYPGIVQRRDTLHDSKPKLLGTVLAALHEMREGRRIVVHVDRRPVLAWMVFVGNGCYGEGMTDIGSRTSLDDHLLDVRIVRADQRFARVRLVIAALGGRLAKTPLIERRTCRAITIDVRGRKCVDVALDGEVVSLPTPLRFETDPGALTVLAPAATD